MKDGRHLPAAAQQALRVRAVRAVVEQGLKQSQVVATMKVGRSSLHGWLALYRAGGYQALVIRRRGRRTGHTRLTQRQQGVICRAIEDKHPEQLKLPFVLWTREAVQRLIAKRYGITLSLNAVGKYLRRWGMSPQKPKKRAYEQCPEAVRRWLEIEYPKIQKQAKKQDAAIYWGDEMGLRSDHQAGRSYSPKGKTPTLTTTGQRFSCNAISALTNRGKLAFMTFKGRFNAKVMIEYLGRLTRHAKRKVLLILDGHPVHKAKKVQDWLAARRDQIEVFLLPGYSPELNPDEYLNQDIKANVFKHERPEDADHMRRQLSGYLRQRQRQPHVIAKFFHHPSVRYAAA